MIAGLARGAPREYHVFSMPASEARARFEESYEIIMKAWTQESFSHEGKFWKYKDISLWPKPYQQPHPPIWIPVTGSKETLDWAGSRNYPIALPEFSKGLIEDIIGYYSKAVAKAGNKVTPDQITLFADAYVADSRAAAIKEYGPYYVYFQNMLFGHGNSVALARLGSARNPASYDYVRPENRGPLMTRAREDHGLHHGRRREARRRPRRLGLAERGDRAPHRGRRACRRQQYAAQCQSRRHAA